MARFKKKHNMSRARNKLDSRRLSKIPSGKKCPPGFILRGSNCIKKPGITPIDPGDELLIPGDVIPTGPDWHITSCFIAGTKVIMSDGSEKNIEDIVVGDKVKGLNGINTILELDWVVLGDRKLYSINDDNYFTTSEHPFMTVDGWKSIDAEKTKIRDGIEMYNKLEGSLSTHDILITNDGEVKIESINSNNL